MWRVPQPAFDAEAVYLTCVRRIRDREVRRRYISVSDEVGLANDAYSLTAKRATLHSLDANDFALSVVSSAEMTELFELKFSRKKSAGRCFYDAIKLAPKFGRCPLCGHRQVETLDHNLPKSKFSALAIAPLNLVPACSECNILKTDSVPELAEDQTLHPYFDNVEDDLWLYARVIESMPASFEFFADPPKHWPQILRKRVSLHFSRFGLSELYGVQAAQELKSIEYHLNLILEAGRSADLRSYLTRQAASRGKLHVNSWQTAAYAAMSASDWFCSGEWVSMP
jgi:5-methylcytosine-specific restriction endonuclease McrA